MADLLLSKQHGALVLLLSLERDCLPLRHTVFMVLQCTLASTVVNA